MKLVPFELLGDEEDVKLVPPERLGEEEDEKLDPEVNPDPEVKVDVPLEPVPELVPLVPELDPLVPELDPLVPELDPLVPELEPLVPELEPLVLEDFPVAPDLLDVLAEFSNSGISSPKQPTSSPPMVGLKLFFQLLSKSATSFSDMVVFKEAATTASLGPALVCKVCST